MSAAPLSSSPGPKTLPWIDPMPSSGKREGVTVSTGITEGSPSSVSVMVRRL